MFLLMNFVADGRHGTVKLSKNTKAMLRLDFPREPRVLPFKFSLFIFFLTNSFVTSVVDVNVEVAAKRRGEVKPRSGAAKGRRDAALLKRRRDAAPKRRRYFFH